MTTLFRGFCALSLVTVGLGAASCGLFKKGGDAADAEAEAAVAEVAEAAPPVVALPTAKNENDISRFPDEKKLDPAVASTLLRNANVREVPGTGKVVTALAKGGVVTQVATRDKFALVVFQKDTVNTMGWIPLDSFTAAPAFEAGILSIKCTAPETALIGDVPLCAKVCTADSDCVAGQACKGASNRLLANGTKGDAVTVCTIFGAPRPVAVLVDAGPAPVAPPIVVVPKCAAGTILVAQDKQCHKSPCRIGQCPADQPLCIACAGTTICVGAAARGLCR